MDKDGVSGVQSSDIISANNLVDVEQYDLYESHDQQLDGTGHSDHGAEGDENCGHSEVSVDQSLDVDVDPRPVGITEIVVI